MAFHVGQKVVCVDAHSGDGEWIGNEAPIEGLVYTVRRVFIGGGGELSLWLDEVNRDQSSLDFRGPDIGYWASRFRPVIERKQHTDISIFKKMLNPKKVDA